jgi:hypothetical protein
MGSITSAVKRDQSGGARRKCEEGIKVSTLEKELNELIARQEDVRPDQVTLELIRDKREAEVYPNAPVNLSMPHGGFTVRAPRFLTHPEGEALIREGTRLLAKYSRKK